MPDSLTLSDGRVVAFPFRPGADQPAPAAVATPPRNRSTHCIHLGPVLERPRACQACWVRKCDLHGTCTLGAGNGHRDCSSCSDYEADGPAAAAEPERIGPTIPWARVVADLQSPRTLKEIGYPAGYWDWPVVISAVRTIAEQTVLSAGSYPGLPSGRGIVIAGGGKYLPGVWVTLSMLRLLGSALPVEVWYFGRKREMPDDWRARLESEFPAVRLIDADAVRRDKGARVLNGFEVKLFSVRHSAFREVLYLDADCYPCVRPDPIFDDPQYLRTGSIWWPDLPKTDKWTRWEKWDAKPDGGPPRETGVYVVDKAKCWSELVLACTYDQMSDVTYRWDYGDKGPPRAAWARMRTPYTVYGGNVPVWRTHSFLHRGPDLATWFVHRCRDKPTLDNAGFYTPQTARGARDWTVPMERNYDRILADLRERVSRGD